ncbi:MAG: hypothetical protein LIO92_00795 [Clostridiales bacterium]|nr:hypothetical protein [Clostridiales bacterium]
MNYHRRGGIPAYVQVIFLIAACLALGGIFLYANVQDKKESERLKQVAEEYRKDEAARAAESRKDETAGAEESGLTLSDGEAAEEDDTLIKYENLIVTNLRTGVSSEFACSTTALEAENYEIDEKATQCLVNDGYLYALSDGSLVVYHILDTGYEEAAEYPGLGDTMDMSFTDDKKGIVVSAGQNGMYIFDVSEPEKITLASQYAVPEQSSGSSSVFVTGDYAFISNGYAGIEIVDISDVDNPVFVNQIGEDSEYQDCFVTGGYLYAGACEQKRIDLYDISDLSNPSLRSQITLEGNAQGVFVSDGILYAATGVDAADEDNQSSDLPDDGKDMGNGLEIYDVSDPEVPVPLSVVKTLGQENYRDDDVWDVAAAGDYAYLSGRYKGLYVFDVSDPENPACVDIYQIEAENDLSSDPGMDAETDASAYDTESAAGGCIGHVWLQDGCFYAAASNMGIYKIEADYITAPDEADSFEYSISAEAEGEGDDTEWNLASESDSSADIGWEIASESDSSI